jgi:hypothetical protein
MIGVCARAWILFSTERMPGVNGAYCLVQARSLIEKGVLGLPDFPLTFVLHAGVASAIQYLTGLSVDASVLLAVKLCTALLPPFAAVPVFLLARQWCSQAGRPGSYLPLVAAALVSFGGQAIGMTGDIDKNALALVWLSGMMFAMHVCMERKTLKSLSMTILFLMLLGLTHVGAFSGALVLAACVCAIYINRPGAPPLKVSVAAIAASLSAICAAAGLVFWKFDPARIERLLRVVSLPVGSLERQTDSLPPMPPPGGPPVMFLVVALLHLALLAGVVACVLRVVWKHRNVLTDADVALVCGSVLAIALMTGPWVHGDMLIRLLIISSVPMIIVATFVLLHIERPRLRHILVGLIFVALIGPGLFQVARGGWHLFSEEAYDEMKSLSSQIQHPERTLIVAMHGMEWNAAWTLHTHVAQTSGLRTGDWQRYDDVLFLVLKDEFAPFGPPGFGPPGRHDRNHGPGPRPPMRNAVEIPEGAAILHDGPHFRLARVNVPPPFVKDAATVQP